MRNYLKLRNHYHSRAFLGNEHDEKPSLGEFFRLREFWDCVYCLKNWSKLQFLRRKIYLETWDQFQNQIKSYYKADSWYKKDILHMWVTWKCTLNTYHVKLNIRAYIYGQTSMEIMYVENSLPRIYPLQHQRLHNGDKHYKCSENR